MRLKAARFTVIFWLGVGSACVYGPKAERKTPMSHLSGENYETGPMGGRDQLILPVVKRKEKATLIEGQVLVGEGIEASPLRNVQVGLYDSDDHLIYTSTSGAGGQFRIHTPVQNGKYLLRLVSNQYNGETPIEVTSYTLTNVLIRAYKTR
jgi:hypothetical protein